MVIVIIMSDIDGRTLFFISVVDSIDAMMFCGARRRHGIIRSGPLNETSASHGVGSPGDGLDS